MIHREIEPDLIDYCREHQIGIVAYSPMGRGLLTGKFNHQRLADLAQDDHRRRYADFQDPRFSDILSLVDDLTRLAKEDQRTVAQLAIAWVLRRPEVTSAIVGARRPEQIRETVQAGNYVLWEDQIKVIEDYLTKRLNLS
jgi:aryl-alcohol dehydrogenase-like predicted oxidoreductase